MPRPIKAEIPEYKYFESRVLEVICRKFGLPTEEPAEVKRADRVLLKQEGVDLMGTVFPGFSQVKDLGYTIKGWDPRMAENAFMWRFRQLTENRPC